MEKKERLDKILSNIGYGSRKDVKKYIKQGSVKVNGKIIKDNSAKINPYDAEIEVDGNMIEYREFIYLMLNKPDGLISSTEDSIHRTVIDLLDEKYISFNPFPVGRLDKDTEGLLVISNDGKLAHNLLSPKKHVDKTYYVKVDGIVNDEDICMMKEGIVLDDGYKTLPAKLEILKSDNISEVYLTIKEGKFHQVKRMFKATGKEVMYLKRIAMGKLKLDDSLLPGQYRELNELEIELLRERR